MFICVDFIVGVLGVIDDISLKDKIKDVENIRQKNLRVGKLQILCLETLNKEEADKEDGRVITIKWRKVIHHDKIESFQSRKWFYLN